MTLQCLGNIRWRALSPLTLGRLAVLAMALNLALAAAPRAQATKDEFVIGLTQYPTPFHPLIGSMLAKSVINNMATRPLTAYDKDWKLVCLLCTEVPTIENGLAKVEEYAPGKKGIAVTYTIQANARWGDGTPVTTKDVLFTWEVGQAPLGGVTEQEGFRRTLKIDVIDDKKFTLHLDRIEYTYNVNDVRLLPAHLERTAFADPREYKNRSKYETDTANPGLWNGPYRFAAVNPGSSIVLEPNPAWYGKKPHFKRITFKFIEKTAALEANLLSGSIDYILGELGVTLDQALEFQRRHSDRFNFIYRQSLTYEHIDLNLENPLLKDRRVRQALLLGIDRESINQKLFDGKQPVAHSNVHPLEPSFSDAAPRYGYDPKKAAALLDAAGFSDIKNGIRHNKQGDRLSLDFVTTAGSRVRELVQQVLQSQWKQIGVEMRLKPEPPRIFSSESLSKRLFTGLAMYAWISAPDGVPRSTLHSKEIPTAANNWSGQNYPAFVNPEMDDVIDAMEIELDAAKRKALSARMQKIYAEELPVLPLYNRSDPFILPKWLKGVEPTGTSYSSTLWVEYWRAE